MKRQILALATVASFLIAACNNKINNGNAKTTDTTETQTSVTSNDVSFTLAKNYFVKNNVAALESPKIESAEKFNEIFGMATAMGKDSKPTSIDFSKEYVIAVVLPQTDLATTINPISLKKNEKGEVVLSYKSVVGQKQSFTTRPNFAIIVNKADNGNVVLNEIK